MSKQKILFGLTGFAPLLFLLGSPPDPTLLVYSLFVLAYFLRNRVTSLIRIVPLPASLKFIILSIFTGLIIEFFAWLGEYLAQNPDPALFHPQLLPNLILGTGFYVSIALAWIIALRFYRFSLKQVFLTMGIYGIAFEQMGAILLQTITNPLTIVWWPYIVMVHGSISALAYMITEEEFQSKTNRDNRLKYLLVLFLIFILILTIGTAWEFLVKILRLIP